jgi:hypothetical protein
LNDASTPCRITPFDRVLIKRITFQLLQFGIVQSDSVR